MKAYAVYCLNWPASGAFLVAAPNVSRAKRWAQSDFDADYIDMRARRCPGADKHIDPAWDRATDMTDNEIALRDAGFNNEDT